MPTPKKVKFIKERLGALPSPMDPRHYRVRSPTAAESEEVPVEYDGLLEYHDVAGWYDQGSVGTCVGWSNSIAMEITDRLLGKHVDNLSAGWIYVRSRFYADVPDWQEGSTNLGAMKALNKEGACTEVCAPTKTTSPFTLTPCDKAGEEAANHLIDSYWYVNSFAPDIKAALYGLTHEAPYVMPDGTPGKIPLVTAYPVYDNYADGYDDGIVPMPSGEFLGGHSSLVRGWKMIDGALHWINSNSWGKDVGDGGTFYLPENYPFYDIWIIHNGPYLPPPEPEPSPCPVGNGAAEILNIIPWVLGRRGRFAYINL